MSQSEIWDALQIVGDALQDGRLDDAEGVLAEVDADGAWDFAIVPYSRQKMREILANAMARTVDHLMDPDAPYEEPTPYEDLVNSIIAVQHAYRYAIECQAPDAVIDRIAHWLTQACDMLYPITAGSDTIVAAVRGWANLESSAWSGVFNE